MTEATKTDKDQYYHVDLEKLKPFSNAELEGFHLLLNIYASSRHVQSLVQKFLHRAAKHESKPLPIVPYDLDRIEKHDSIQFDATLWCAINEELESRKENPKPFITIVPTKEGPSNDKI